MIVSEQLRAARALLHWKQDQLSKASGVPVPTIKRLEGRSGPFSASFETVSKLTAALDPLVIFIDDPASPGVRLRPAAQQAA